MMTKHCVVVGTCVVHSKHPIMVAALFLPLAMVYMHSVERYITPYFHIQYVACSEDCTMPFVQKKTNCKGG